MRTILSISILLCLTACSDRATEPSTLALEGLWQLSTLETAAGTLPAEPGVYTAEFRTDGTLSVRADCNRCSAGYSASDAALSIGPLACTRAYCGSESLFDPYVGALDRSTGYRFSGALLLVSFDSGTLQFEPAR
jgi:heat shock protein HslJ